MLTRGKKYFQFIFTAGFFFWSATMLGNVLNWFFNVQAGRQLTNEDFAILSVFLSFQYLANVAAVALQTTVARFTAYYSEKGETEKQFNFFRQYWWFSWGIGILSFLVYGFLHEGLNQFFDLDLSILSFVFGGILIPLFLVAFERGILSGQLAFVWVGIVLLSEAIAKLIFFTFAPMLHIKPLTAAVLALPFSVGFAWFVSVLIGRSFHPLPQKISAKTYSSVSNTFGYLSNAFFAGLGTVLIYNSDVLLVKHFFTGSEAGLYATLSLLGKMLYFGAGSLVGLLIPLVAREQAKGNDGLKFFGMLLAMVTILGGAILSLYTFAPNIIVPLLLTNKALVTLPYLSTYSTGMFAFVIAYCFSAYHLGRKNYVPARLMLLAGIIETILLCFFHSSIAQVVAVVSQTMFGLLIAMLIAHFVNTSKIAFTENIKSFIELLQNSEIVNHKKKKKILIFNWRDINHTQAGGAEHYIHNLSKNLIKQGYSITLFTANDGKNKRYEVIDGVSVIRRGGFRTVYVWAMIYYIFKFSGKFDLIIDSENGIPFFTPIFANIPIVLLVHHVHQDIFFQTYTPPWSWIATFLESFLMPFLYKKSTIVTVSPSTKKDLVEVLGMDVTSVIPAGIYTNEYKPGKKTLHPTITYVGRLKKYKSIEVLIDAFKILLKQKPTAHLTIAGDGDWKDTLEEKVHKLKLTNHVIFVGKVTEEEKISLLKKSWLVVQPSFIEGWGITCLEANACGTPVLASNVSGLKDAVVEGKSGKLFTYGDSTQLGNEMISLIKNKRQLLKLNKTSRNYALSFSWALQVRKYDTLINKILSQKDNGVFALSVDLMSKFQVNIGLLKMLNRKATRA